MQKKINRGSEKINRYQNFLDDAFKKFSTAGNFKRVGKKETVYRNFLEDAIKKFRYHLIFPAHRNKKNPPTCRRIAV